MSEYRKRPVVIEAFKWTGGPDQEEDPVWAADAMRAGKLRFQSDAEAGGVCAFIDTLEGTMKACPGDWIIRGVKGELYPCRSDIFEATYEPV